MAAMFPAVVQEPYLVKISRSVRNRCVFTLLGLLLASASVLAQCRPADSGNGPVPGVPAQHRTLAEPVLPEAGFLSDTHYTSQFFGFSLDLPLTVHGHQIMLPLMPEKEHALLALQYEDGAHKGYIVITAKDPVPGWDYTTPEEKQRQVLRPGQLPNYTPLEVPQYMLRPSHFERRLTHHGRTHAAEYSATINNYVVKIAAASSDGDFIRKLKQAMDQVEFYCPQDDGTLWNQEGKPAQVAGQRYSGPTVPTLRVDTSLRDAPGKNISLGEVSEGVYRNPEIGLQYQLPKGWRPVEPKPSPPPLEPAALREYQFFHSCSQILLQAAPQQPAGNYGLVVRALDLDCLAMRTPVSLSDKASADEVAASLERLGEFGHIESDQLMSIYNHLFVSFHGTIPSSQSGEGLAQRLSQTIFVTRYNKLLLTWSFAAESRPALEQMPGGTIVLEGSPPIQLSLATQAQGRSASR